MTRLLASLFRPEAVVRSRWELLVLRLGIAYLLYWQVPRAASGATSQAHPHGFARWGIDFTWMGDASWFQPLLAVYFVAVVAYALGYGLMLPLSVVLLFQTCVSTLNLSQGVQGHSGQVVMLTILGMILGAFVERFFPAAKGEVRANGGPLSRLRPTAKAQSMAFLGGVQAFVATYLVAGVTKLIESDGEWLSRSKNFVLQWRKAADETLYTTGEAPGRAAEWFGSVLLDHAWVAPIFLTCGLLLELAAPLALLNRRIACVLGVFFLLFHQSLGLLMGLPFHFNQYLALLLLINPAGWLLRERSKPALQK